jgi:predicted SAM-dependent methyltransferase
LGARFRMKLYLGSREYKPDGFLTVDIDARHEPDIVADVTDLQAIESESVEEICASHILEHLPWPLAYKALGEWTRVLRTGGRLRVAVPDLAALATMIAEGHNAWTATALIYGVGRLENQLEAHQYGYTRGMLISILRSLGFRNFDWWKHDMPDASNGWMHDEDSGRVGISLNLAAEKISPPLVPPERLLPALMANRMRPFDQVLAEHLAFVTDSTQAEAEQDPLLTQRIHMALIEARMRILYLENELGHKR